MCSGGDEFHSSLAEWLRRVPAGGVCYEPVARRDMCSFVVGVRLEIGTVTDDKSKVTCQECLEMIHA